MASLDWAQCRALTLFASLSDAALKETISRGQIVQFADRQVLFEENTHIGGMYIVLSGVVKMTRVTQEGREIVIHLVRHGKFVGEGSVFLRGGTIALCGHAVGKVKALFLPSSAILHLLAAYPEVAVQMLTSLSKRLRMFSHKIVSEGQYNAMQRVASYLLHRCRIQKNNEMVWLDTSREVLANLLGLARETLSRQLGALAEAGAIRVQGRRVYIVDGDRLACMAKSGCKRAD